jgi:anti-anti-sigma regulatory factor
MVAVMREEAGGLVIRIEGRLDRLAAGRIARALGDVPSAAPLVVDFSRVEDLSDAGVAELANHLARRPGVAVRGLGRHQLRLLRYCGFQPPAEPLETDADEARR